MTPFGCTHRLTHEKLPFNFGPDRGRPLVVTLKKSGDADLVEFRPYKTTRPVAGKAIDLYHYLLRCEANKQLLERARAAKARNATRLAAQRQARAEKRLFKKGQ